MSGILKISRRNTDSGRKSTTSWSSSESFTNPHPNWSIFGHCLFDLGGLTLEQKREPYHLLDAPHKDLISRWKFWGDEKPAVTPTIIACISCSFAKVDTIKARWNRHVSQRIISYGKNLFYSSSHLFNTTEVTIEHSSLIPSYSKLAEANACICLCRWLGKAGSGRIDGIPWLDNHQIQFGSGIQDNLQMKEKLSCCFCTPFWNLDRVRHLLPCQPGHYLKAYLASYEIFEPPGYS